MDLQSRYRATLLLPVAGGQMGQGGGLMSCNVLHPQCWQQARWIGAGGARNMHSRETVGNKAQIGLPRTAGSAAERASAVLPRGEKEGREAAAGAGLLSEVAGGCLDRGEPPLRGAYPCGGARVGVMPALPSRR